MYTQCPKCETIFRLSADVLRVASGNVRCGRCGHAFLALTRLAERPEAFAAGESRIESVIEPPPESHLESEIRADLILGAAPAEPGAAEPFLEDEDSIAMADTQIEHLRVLGGIPAADDASLEFTLPPGELDRIFIEAKQPPWPMSPPPAQAPDAPHPEDADAQPYADERTYAPAAEPLEPRPARKSRAGLLIGAAVFLTLALAAQVIDRNRVYIAANTPFGGALRALYSTLGYALPVPGNVAAYQLRQWGVTGDPGASGTLRVRASILNTAAQFQPYPLLRVTLTDRFGNLVGAREFEPAEYSTKPPSALMAPGMRSDATINIVDPGKNAEGFEIDVCLRGADRRIVCAGDAAAHAQ